MTILSKLKESTKEQHQALESVVDVMDQANGLESYKRLISKFYLLYSAIEPELPYELLKENGFDLDRRRKLPSLENDLTYLAITDPEKVGGIGKPDVPTFDTAAKGFGASYVLEGATLGGQIITRHLNSTFGLNAEEGAAFFSSYGANVGPMWKEFGRIITEFSDANDADDEIVSAAIKTFDTFHQFLSRAAARSAIIVSS